MTEQVKRVYVIGLDGMMFPMYERFAAEGLLPNLKKLADAGIVGEAYPSMPVWTPTKLDYPCYGRAHRHAQRLALVSQPAHAPARGADLVCLHSPGGSG